MNLSTLLLQELATIATPTNEPNAAMFVDSSAIFWVSPSGHFVLIAEHDGISDYIDFDHPEVEGRNPEGVDNSGVYWNNLDFENPFHVTDFEKVIETINTKI